MPYARELKKGQIVSINNQYYIACQIETKSPSARGAQTLYKVRFRTIPGGQKLDQTLAGDNFLDDVHLAKRPVSYLYREGDECTFMDTEDYNQYLVNIGTIEESLRYINEGQEGITALLVEGQLLALELPSSVILSIVDTSPPIKGASAAARNKPACLSTGLKVQVPEYLSPGEKIKINTETGKFMFRV